MLSETRMMGLCIGFVLVVFGVWTLRVQADEWSQEKEQRKERVTQEAKEAGKAIIEAQQQEKSAMDQKNAALQARFEKTKQLTAKLLTAGHRQNALRLHQIDALQTMSHATWLYLEEHKKHLQQAETIAASFLAYKATENTQARTMTENIHLVPQAQTAAELIRPMINLCETAKGERTSCFHLASESKELAAQIKNAHQAYLTELAPFWSLFQANPIPMPALPTQQIQQLESIAAYSTVREHSVSGQASETLPTLSNRIHELLREAAHAEAKRIYERRLKWQEGMDFLAIVNGLGGKKLGIARDPSNQCLCGRRQKLAPYFEIFENILAYRDRCVDYEHMDWSTSLGTACMLYMQMFREAEGFFRHGAIAKIAISLSYAQKNSPTELAALVGQLDEAITHYDALGSDQTHEELLGLILIHDDLLMRWNECIAPASSGDVG